MNTGSLNALAVRGRSGGSPSAATAHCGLLKYGPCQWASSPPSRAGQRNRSGVGIETPGEGVVHPIVDGMRGARCRAARGPQAPHSPRHARARSGWHLADAAAQADGNKVVRAKVVQLLDNSPFIRRADTLTELAKKMEVDVAAFLATIERYNVACKQGLENEPEFGKPLKASKPFDTPLLRRSDLPAGAQEFRRRQDRSAMPRARQAL